MDVVECFSCVSASKELRLSRGFKWRSSSTFAMLGIASSFFFFKLFLLKVYLPFLICALLFCKPRLDWLVLCFPSIILACKAWPKVVDVISGGILASEF